MNKRNNQRDDNPLNVPLTAVPMFFSGPFIVYGIFVLLFRFLFLPDESWGQVLFWALIAQVGIAILFLIPIIIIAGLMGYKHAKQVNEANRIKTWTWPGGGAWVKKSDD